MKIGMIFPGQGTQFLGMCKELYDRERIIQELFEHASSCLDQNFVRLCFASSEKELKETINAQTSIFLASASIYTLLSSKYGIKPDLVAGHSSGEYSAIFAAGGMTFADSLYLLKKRALFLEEATKKYHGGMLAALALPFETVQAICKKYDDPSSNEKVAEIVNYNSPTQFVISGTLPELNAIASDIKAAGGKGIALNVSGAFHSRLMKEAEKNFTTYLVKVDFKDLQAPLVNNVEAKMVQTNKDIKTSLVKQMSSNVLWWPAMEQFKNMDLIIEIGPDSKYSKMIKREWPTVNIVSVNTPKDVEQLLVTLNIEVEKTEMELILESELKKNKGTISGAV
ncbi:MAG: Malonyl CoA-acyl carrier protein transacylase [candidate division TM6 bacterium GW2011_GWF2_37_49]|nr:MAG: Malonyl CoA-acyl carrier protein transacylase [candidate division TM6 bacterium GW2011_GWF2_37_49]